MRSVPDKQRDDLAAELRASIADDIDARIDAGEPAADAERAVLSELGDPDKLGAGYAERPLWLIGPRYYLQWRRLVTLLLWVNLVARLALYIAAWIANPPSPVVENVKADDLHVKETPNYVTLSAPHTLTWDFDQRTGAVLFSEAEREVREAADAERAEREAQLAAALEAASTQGGWLEQRLARRRARKAVREARSTQEP